MTSETGASQDSSGGVTEFLHITAMSVERLLLQERCRQYVLSADALISHRMRMYLIHGSAQHFGRSPHLDGLTRHLSLTISILTQ